MKKIATWNNKELSEDDFFKFLSDENFISRKKMKSPGEMVVGSYNGEDITLIISWQEYQKVVVRYQTKAMSRIKIHLKDYKKRNRRKRKSKKRRNS